MNKRNETIKYVKAYDIVVCIKDSYTFTVGKTYRVKEVDTEFVSISRTEHSIEHYPRIQRLNLLLEAYKNCKDEDVKSVLDVTLEPIRNRTYFEDVFITLREQRRRKLEKIMETDE